MEKICEKVNSLFTKQGLSVIVSDLKEIYKSEYGGKDVASSLCWSSLFGEFYLYELINLLNQNLLDITLPSKNSR